MDNYSRECLAIYVGQSLRGRDVVNVLERIKRERKIVPIVIGRHWEAVAENAFHEGLRKRVLNKPELIVFLLKEASEVKIKSFWYFYFDGPQTSNHIAEPLLKIKMSNLKIYYLMMEAHNEVLKQTI